MLDSLGILLFFNSFFLFFTPNMRKPPFWLDQNGGCLTVCASPSDEKSEGDALGIALIKAPFVSTSQAILLAPFISTFLHDGFSAIWMLLYNAIRGQLKKVWETLVKTRGGKFIVLGAIIGGPIGMTGYMLCVTNLGASIGAAASAVYPAIGAAMAHFFLKERMPWYRWCFLVVSLCGVFILSYSPELEINNFLPGVLGAVIYSVGMSAENIILAKCLRQPDIPFDCALNIRQITSSLVTGAVFISIFRGWDMTGSLIANNTENVILIIASAALFGTVSYMLYAMSLMKIGVAKTLALNGTCCAWAFILEVLLLGHTYLLNSTTIIGAVLTVIFGILAA